MAKKKEPDKKPEAGEQMDLIDVAPENAKEIIEAGKLYKKYQAERIAWAVKEADQKAVILEKIHEAKIPVLAGGKIKFEYDGFKITVTPRDELVQVKEPKAKAPKK